MTQLNFIPGIIFHMDNLVILRGMNAETVALIATDPLFNTGRNRESIRLQNMLRDLTGFAKDKL